MANFLNQQQERILFAYHRARNLWPIWYYLLNREPHSLWKACAPELNEAQKRVAAALKKDGIAVLHFSELFSGGFFEKLRTHAAGYDNAVQPVVPMTQEEGGYGETYGKSPPKEFITMLWGGGGTNPPLDLRNPFIQFALDEKILAIAGQYLGASPKFHGFSLQLTRLVPPGSPERLSQRWHRDPDDKKIVKAFLYLNDVLDEGTGPFMYVKGSHYGGKWRSLFPQRPPIGVYPKAGVVESIVPKDDIEICLGKAGTMVFCDTSGLHKGGYSTTKTRLMFAAGFVSKASVHPINYQRPSEGDIKGLPPLVRYALK